MIQAIHIVDPSTPADMLDRLELLADAKDAVFSAGPRPKYPEFAHPVQAIHRPLGSAYLCGWRMRDAARDAGTAEVVHAWSPAAARAGAMMATELGRPLVLSVPCLPLPKALGRLIGWAKIHSVTLTVPTQAARRVMIAAGAPESRVHSLLPPTRAIEGAAGKRRRVREALRLGDGDKLIVAPAEMTRYAGHKYASWVHAILRQIRQDVRLLLPGTGPHFRHVKFFAATTGYDAEVFLTEHRFRRDECLAAADVAFFLAERDSGTAALAAAMAASLPIVAASTPDIAEVAPGEKAGVPPCAILASPHNPQAGTVATLRILDDPAFARRLGENAAARATERFNPSVCRDRLRQMYAEIVRQEAEPVSVAT